ncbi:unnamed protein product [Thlaspi arvense]|uniref:Coenzyme Q-binding protein COQ10 START domain-containing protein n=1 Tax=Thlaspi arvense TaxID=13288 RepID=A0AAU9SW99_THLAR|nr:unnamed protein product [Thlaspi arvense]
MQVEVPVSVAYGLYSDRESIPRWMIFISSVKVLKEKPDLSRWTLKYKAFGQNLEYSWLAKNLQASITSKCCESRELYKLFCDLSMPLPNQKIHWISLEGLPNKGTVRFFPLGPSSCDVEALQPLMQGLIKSSLEQFAEIAKSTKTA